MLVKLYARRMRFTSSNIRLSLKSSFLPTPDTCTRTHKAHFAATFASTMPPHHPFGKKKRKDSLTSSGHPLISPSELAECFRNTLSTDASVREAAERSVKTFTIKNQSSCAHFCHLACSGGGGEEKNDNSDSVGVRMAAALAPGCLGGRGHFH